MCILIAGIIGVPGVSFVADGRDSDWGTTNTDTDNESSPGRTREKHEKQKTSRGAMRRQRNKALTTYRDTRGECARAI